LTQKIKKAVISVAGLLESTGAGVGGEIQLTDALDELLKLDGLNAFETDAGVFDCGNKKGYLSANLAVGMRDPETKQYMKALIKKERLVGFDNGFYRHPSEIV